MQFDGFLEFLFFGHKLSGRISVPLSIYCIVLQIINITIPTSVFLGHSNILHAVIFSVADIDTCQ